MSALDLAAVRSRFPALSRVQDGRPVVFADAPGGSQVPDTVIEAVSQRYRDGISNMDGAFVVSEETEELAAAARRAGADLVGAEPNQIVFGANSTSLLLHLSRSFARTIGPGDTVVVTRLDHDANVRPWVLAARDAGATVRWVDLHPEDATLDLESFDDALTEGPALVAFTLASNGVGTVTPAADLVARAKSAGALVAVDGVHFAQHRSIGFRDLGADMVTVSPYKVFGPHLGMVAAKPDILDAWDAYRVRPADHYPSPERWETGTQNHEGFAGFIAAVDYLAGLGRTRAPPARPRAPTRSPQRSTRSVSTNEPSPPGSWRAWRRSRRHGCTASPAPTGWPSGPRRSRFGWATSIPGTRRRRSRSAGSSPGTGTITRWSCSSGWTSWRRAAPSGSASATTTRRTRSIGSSRPWPTWRETSR